MLQIRQSISSLLKSLVSMQWIPRPLSKKKINCLKECAFFFFICHLKKGGLAGGSGPAGRRLQWQKHVNYGKIKQWSWQINRPKMGLGTFLLEDGSQKPEMNERIFSSCCRGGDDGLVSTASNSRRRRKATP